MKTTPIPDNAYKVETLETALADLAVAARAVMKLIHGEAGHKQTTHANHADLVRLEILVSDLLFALQAR
jgi:hypothetical protein